MYECDICGTGFMEDIGYLDDNGVCGSEVCQRRFLAREGKFEAVFQLTMSAVVEKIPDGDADNPEFKKWCEEKEIYALAGARRGWWSAHLTYIRDYAYILHLDNGSTVFLTEKEYQEKLIKVL